MPAICPASSPLSVHPGPARGSGVNSGSRDARRALGIVVCEGGERPPFAEAAFIRRLIAEGSRLELDVFAFSPATWDEARGTVRAWTWSRSGWSSAERPAPALAYDRAWPADAEMSRRYLGGLNRMIAAGGLALLNSRLPGKREVLRLLAARPELRRRLPPTAAYKGERSLSRWLDRHEGAAFLKPSGGSKGKRVLAIVRVRSPDGGRALDLRGRTAANRPFRLAGLAETEALARIGRWIGGRAYLMQPLLELRAVSGEPFDLRLLAQRGGDGRWKTAGLAVRCGRADTVTANLHGGGAARPAAAYLTEQFGEARAAAMIEDLRAVAASVIEELEAGCGKFAELGLDFGIDRSGRIWFLEANSKPGRAAMTCVGSRAAEEAARRPLAYARYILLRPPGRVFHEFDHM